MISDASDITYSREHYLEEARNIAQQVIQQIEKGASNWEMPWHKGIPLAINRVTGSLYGGMNLTILCNSCQIYNYSLNHWATLKQWRKLGGTVQKGEKSKRIVVVIKKNKKEELIDLRISLFEDYSDKENFNFIFRRIPVFNIDQVRNLKITLPDLFQNEYYSTDSIDLLVKRSGAQLYHGGDEAYYQKKEDYIQMPYKASFHSTIYSSAIEGYYTTLLHEIIHWTGHSQRCNREGIVAYSEVLYAFEELVAELGCAILSTHFQQRIEPRAEHAKYIGDWLRVLKHDFNFYYQAQNQAIQAIYWLFDKTGTFPFKLKKRTIVQVKDSRLEEWVEIIRL